MRTPADESGCSPLYRAGMQSRRNYAVLWSGREGKIGSGRLELVADRVELSSGRDLVTVQLGEVTGSRIARGVGDRLRGLPVLALASTGGEPFRIASLEGTGALYEIAALVERAAPAFRSTGT
jgi:hypothetical protein